MKLGPSSLLANLLAVALPLLLASLAFYWFNRKKQTPEKKGSALWKTFGVVYLVIQGAVTGFCIQDGMHGSGTENIPAWGVAAFTSWGASILITPFIAIIVASLINAFRKYDHGA
jgi:hypothetical protein